MVKAVLQFLLIFLGLVLVLTFESVVGLPVIFLALVGVLSGMYRNLLWWPLVLLTFLSFVMAVSYQMAMAAALLLLIAVVIFVARGERLVERRTARLAAAVGAGSLLVALLSPITINNLSWLTLFFQVIIVLGIIWKTVGFNALRQ